MPTTAEISTTNPGPRSRFLIGYVRHDHELTGIQLAVLPVAPSRLEPSRRVHFVPQRPKIARAGFKIICRGDSRQDTLGTKSSVSSRKTLAPGNRVQQAP